MHDQKITIAVTGASGSIYAERLIDFLLPKVARIYLCASQAGISVAQHELKEHEGDQFSLLRALRGKLSDSEKQKLRLLDQADLFAPIASGSSAPDSMVVVPCSMGTLARVAHGMSTNLIERAADVVLKEKRKFVIVPRETPLHTIHLENMLKLANLGTHIVPAMPAFYTAPKTLDDAIDFVVGRVIEALGFDHNLYRKWNQRMT